jgi:hypothetical protein
MMLAHAAASVHLLTLVMTKPAVGSDIRQEIWPESTKN